MVVDNGAARLAESEEEEQRGLVFRRLRLGLCWDVWREVEVSGDGMVVLGGRRGRRSCWREEEGERT